MSNVIKAMNIRYTQEKRTLDLNERADGFQRLYVENLAKAQEIEKEKAMAEDELSEESDLEAEELENTRNKVAELLDEGTVDAAEINISRLTENRLSEEELKALMAEEHENLLSEVQEECARLKAETQEECDRIINETRAEIEVARSEAYNQAKEEGYKDGLLRAQTENDALKQELENKIAAMDEELVKKVDELEPQFVDLMIKLIQKITGMLIEDRRDLILHVVRASMLGLDKSNKYIIHASKDDYPFLNSKRQELCNELKGNVVEVVEDPILERAQCTIETDTRIFDVSLDVQLRNLINDLRLLSEN